MELSIVSPMYNEEDNIEGTVREIQRVLAEYEKPWELILVNDGSTDRTLAVATKIADQYENVSVVSYPKNRGRGYALRTGFARAKGALIITIESDLSWNADCMLDMLRTFDDDPSVDLILGSPYMKGGRTENVPFHRLAISKLGNKLLGVAMPGRLNMVTQMFRAYRREVIEALELEADRKEIHLEILSKALAAGYRAIEIPAILKWRAGGVSSFRLKTTAVSHLLFSFYEKPALLFGAIGLLMALIGLLLGLYIIVLWSRQTLNPVRPLMTVLVLFVLGGIQFISFGFIGTQIAALRKEVIKVQRQNRLLEKAVSQQLVRGEEEHQDTPS
ncbi:glycosyl transferase family 2 [candidate division KSB3 bacterium]|uniref:Glycosyl transferase family 2 n=1 Tax=candidate division KSB3 bacterium TaxID=2044937 RepID=A0A2G6KHP2_9BACT|nr:MAG: glycosyl transferase family 2 [candidate division KSB3 bacterium]